MLPHQATFLLVCSVLPSLKRDLPPTQESPPVRRRSCSCATVRTHQKWQGSWLEHLVLLQASGIHLPHP